MAIELVYKRLGERIRATRKRRGWSQELLAGRVGLIRTSVVNIEAGRQRILFHDIKTFASALKIKPAMLLRGIW